LRTDRRNRSVCITLAFSVLLIVVHSASAHAILVGSSPPSKGLVRGPDVSVRLRFNVRVDQQRSRLTLIRPDSSSQSLVIAKQTSPDMLTAQATALVAGEYRIRWQVLASDGHITGGEILFTVE